MKIFKLIYNELVKIFKKPSVKIIFVLILMSAIILPSIISNIPIDRYSANALESNKFMLEQQNQIIEQLKSDKTQKGKMEYEYAIIDRDVRKMMVDNKIGFDDWRDQVVEYYKTAAYNLAVIEFVLEGYSQEVVMEGLRNTDSDKVISYYDTKMTLAKKKEIESYYIKEKEKFLKILENNDYQEYSKERIKEIEGFIANRENTIKEYKKLKAKNPYTEEGKAELLKLEEASKDAKEDIPNFKQDIEIIQFRIDNKIDYDLNNWKNNSLKTIEKEIEDLRIKLMSEKEYSNAATQQQYSMSYNEYVENYDKSNAKRVNKIKEIWYGVENNIPALADIRDARSVLDSSYEIYIILAVIMIIIIGGGIVSTEFSKGTVRLLLIRPVSRWKILLSKLLAILGIGFAILISGITILYISTGFVFGFETYNTPILETINGTIVHVEFIKYILPKIVLSSSTLIFITSIVFMVSTLAKNTALAVAVSMVLYLGTAPATDLLISMKQTWIVNTVIPYINASYLRLVPITSGALSQSFGMQLQYESGAIQLLLISIVLLAITFIAFVKKDIKN